MVAIIASALASRLASVIGLSVLAGCSQRVSPVVKDGRASDAAGEVVPAPVLVDTPAPVLAENFASVEVSDAGAGPAGDALREVFPHVRFDAASKVVEFDGEVPIDCHNLKTPRIYLEVTVCARDSKEHEALVVTDAKPSHVHAALLLAGLEPGTPGRWTIENGQTKKVSPSGAAVEVSIVWRDAWGVERTARATDWVVSTKGARLGGSFVFAGSRIVPWQGREFYDGDGTGVLIGLTTFGSETVAYSELLSPESAIEAPEWIADVARVPTMGTRVVVRVREAASLR